MGHIDGYFSVRELLVCFIDEDDISITESYQAEFR